MQILSIFYQIALERPTKNWEVEQHMAAISNGILAYQQLDRHMMDQLNPTQRLNTQ